MKFFFYFLKKLVMHFQIVDENNCNLGPNESGEICVKFSFPFIGYLRNDKLTQETYDSAGWCHTGDVGHFDDENFLFFEGRMKDMLRFRGSDGNHYDINCSTVEASISSATGVLQLCVVGVTRTEVAYDFPAAAVVLPPGVKYSVEEFQKIVDEKCWPYHLQGGVVFVEKLPQTFTGKVKRHDVKKLVDSSFAIH